jgi:molecular chaperone DnaJ
MATTARQDYYEVLGVPRKAAAAEIRKAYKRLARKYHPDVNPGDRSAEERFKRIQEAYDVLSDSKKRQMYDQVGYYSESGVPPGGFRAQQQGAPGFDFQGFDFSEVFGQQPRGGGRAAGFGESLRDMFSHYFSGGGAARTEPVAQRGEDLEYQISVGFWEAIRGTVARLNATRLEACSACGGTGSSPSSGIASCPECKGTGKVTQAAGAMRFQLSCPRCGGTGKLKHTCPGCHGDGRLSRSENIEVRIPTGTQNGTRLRVAGKGNAGLAGGPAGDLYIIVRVEPHPYFRREGDDIHIAVPVTVSEAALGAKIEVPTIDGRALLRIPPGTQSGQKFRVRERGVTSPRTGRRGDQYVEVQVHVPRVMDEKSKEILRELARLNPDDPRARIFEQQ